MKYAWIKEHRGSFSISTMCRVLKVSRSGFYKSMRATPSRRSQRTEAIKASVRIAYDQSKGIYGSYKIADQLRTDERLETACRYTVASAMREMGLERRVC